MYKWIIKCHSHYIIEATGMIAAICTYKAVQEVVLPVMHELQA